MERGQLPWKEEAQPSSGLVQRTGMWGPEEGEGGAGCGVPGLGRRTQTSSSKDSQGQSLQQNPCEGKPHKGFTDSLSDISKQMSGCLY